MAKRQPFDTNLSFPPAPTRALLSTPLDGIIGGPAPRPEPPSDAVLHQEVAKPQVHMSIEPEPAGVDVPQPPAESAEPPPSHAPLPQRHSDGIADDRPRESTTVVERTEPVDDGKVTVKLPPDLKNRLYNAIYAERGTVGDYLTRAVEDLIYQLERDRGGAYPQRPPADEKFRAGRRPR